MAVSGLWMYLSSQFGGGGGGGGGWGGGGGGGGGSWLFSLELSWGGRCENHTNRKPGDVSVAR